MGIAGQIAFVLCLLSFVLPVLAAPTDLSPATTEANPVRLLTESQYDYLYNKDYVARDAALTGGSMSEKDFTGGSPVTLSWKGTSGTCSVEVRKIAGDDLRTVAASATALDGAVAEAATVREGAVVWTGTTSGTSVSVVNLELDADYEWTVTDSSGGAASATFRTSAEPPRLVKAGEMAVMRDLGGWTGWLGGKPYKVRQNQLFRGGPAKNVDAAATAFFHDIVGLRTELDFRGTSGDRLNVTGVAYVPLSRDSYYCVTKEDMDKKDKDFWPNLIESFKVIFDAKQRPAYFHCSIGRDRTGITAFLALALLGVSEEDLWRDYQASSYKLTSSIVKSGTYMAGYIRDMKAFKPNAGTINEAVADYFVNDLGFTANDIETFRKEMLIGYGEPPPPAFAVTPYLQNPGADAMTIIFFTTGPCEATVEVRPAGDNRTVAASATALDGAAAETATVRSATTVGVWAQALTNNVYHLNQNDKEEKNKWNNSLYRHRVRFEGLEANRTYAYTVTLGGPAADGATARGEDRAVAASATDAGTVYQNVFRTAPDRNTPIRFVSYADCETMQSSHRNDYTMNLRRMKERDPDLITTAGDLTARGGIQSHWDEFWMQNAGGAPDGGTAIGYTDILGSIPMLTAIGNHDLFDNADHTVSGGWFQDRQGEVATEKFLSYFEFNSNGVAYACRDGTRIPETRDMSQLFHREDYGPVTLIFLDTNNGQDGDADADHDRDTNYDKPGDSQHTEGGMDRRKGARHPDFNPGSPQYDWLTNQLADAQANSRFTFVFNHHCPYSVGGHNKSWTTGEDASALAVRVLTGTMVRYGVDGWICGHDELLEHSITNGWEILPNGQRRRHTLSVYDVGCSGDSPRNSGGASNPLAYWKGDNNYGMSPTDSQYGFLETDVTTNRNGRWTCTITPVQGSTGKYLGAQVVYVENPDRGENENDLVYAEYAKTSPISGVSPTRPSDWLAWERPPEGPGAPTFRIEEPHFVTATRTTVRAGKPTEVQYTGFLTEKGCWYAWGRDGKAETAWRQGDGTPCDLEQPEGDGWELLVR